MHELGAAGSTVVATPMEVGRVRWRAGALVDLLSSLAYCNLPMILHLLSLFQHANLPETDMRIRLWISKLRPKFHPGKVPSGGNGSSDILGEKNRGPRGNIVIYTDQYNKEDFSLDYENAKFFVIKSYSEDDVHKSIKYNVWSSTPPGNKKLESAYEDAQKIAAEKSGRWINGCQIGFYNRDVDFVFDHCFSYIVHLPMMMFCCKAIMSWVFGRC
ncbi:hypothetical protein V8G54_023928 [Vigna mungo]|uniref:YTH domain-containing family protein n=1 Tax=Vigna mungo TaxID=3915 RepID=A0AAQ3RQT8_VIGMU